jgi:hypothetical protein
MVVGMSSAIDLRLLGVAKKLPLAPFESFFPIIWVGLLINALSGAGLLVADASTKMIDPVFWIKMVFIVFAVVITRLLRGHVFTRPSSLIDTPITGRAKLYAGASLFCWTGAITAGRLMAYLGPRARL